MERAYFFSGGRSQAWVATKLRWQKFSISRSLASCCCSKESVPILRAYLALNGDPYSFDKIFPPDRQPPRLGFYAERREHQPTKPIWQHNPSMSGYTYDETGQTLPSRTLGLCETWPEIDLCSQASTTFSSSPFSSSFLFPSPLPSCAPVSRETSPALSRHLARGGTERMQLSLR